MSMIREKLTKRLPLARISALRLPLKLKQAPRALIQGFTVTFFLINN